MSRTAATPSDKGRSAWREDVRRLVAVLPRPRRPDAGKRGHRGSLIFALAFLAVALLWPIVANGYWLYIGTTVLVYTTLALGYNVILGWAGQLAFTSTAFFGIGALAAGLYAKTFPGSFFLFPLAVSVLAGGAFALISGVVVVRLHRYYFAVATLAIVYLLDFCYRNLVQFTGGPSGFQVPRPGMAVAGGGVMSEAGLYFVALGIAALSYIVLARLRRSALGRSWIVVRQDEDMAQALGISPYRSKLAAFVVSGIVMALAGGWFVFLLSRFLPESFGLDELLFVFVVVVVGGLGSLNGAVMGSIALVITRQSLTGIPGMTELLLGLLLLVTALAAPHGLYGALSRRVPRLREPFA